MFYSHTFLARKSPLGTVWVAAHLERRIKKPHIEGIHIPSYADIIMFPEVPLALRLSGHLLLGLVRIYSWKVNYLFQDCNRMLTDVRTAFATVQVNLPIDADRAPFESVTSPISFQLDALDLDESVYQTDGPDKHLTTYDQITMGADVEVEEPYVTVFINEGNGSETSPRLDSSNFGPSPMEEDILPPFEGSLDDLAFLATPTENIVGCSSGPNNQVQFSVHSPHERNNQAERSVHSPNERHSPQEFNDSRFLEVSPDIGAVMRDAVHNPEPENLQEVDDTFNDIQGEHEHSVPRVNRKVSLSPIMEGISASGAGSLLSPSFAKGFTVASANDLDSETSSGKSLYLELQLSPPVQQQKAKTRKRKQFYDEAIVLSNEDMKKQFADTSKLVCKQRRVLPTSALEAWKFHRACKNERFFHEPLLSGICTTLQEAYDKSFPPSRADSNPRETSPLSMSLSPSHVLVPQVMMEPVLPGADTDPVLPEDSTEPVLPRNDMEPVLPGADTQTVLPGADMEPILPGTDMEPEQPRFGSHFAGDHPDPFPTPSGREDFTPHTSKLGSVSDRGKTFETEPSEIPASAEPVDTELETPLVHLNEQPNRDDSHPHQHFGILNSTDEELCFLETSSTSSGYDVAEVGNLPDRTRLTAQYIKDHSPATQILGGQLGDLSLMQILEGKHRKKCARMFFETLVLKSCGLIIIEQDEAYGDIIISATPALYTAKF